MIPTKLHLGLYLVLLSGSETLVGCGIGVSLLRMCQAEACIACQRISAPGRHIAIGEVISYK